MARISLLLAAAASLGPLAAALLLGACGPEPELGPVAERPPAFQPPPASPYVRLSLPSGQAYRAGDPIPFILTWTAFPAGHVIAVEVVRDVPDDWGRRYLGDTGLVRATIPRPEGTGRATVEWNGRDACHPTDVANSPCGPVQPGRYRLRVTLHGAGDVWTDRRRTPPRGESWSDPFYVIGPHDLTLLEDALGREAVGRLRKDPIARYLPGDGRVLRLLTPTGPVERRREGYCQDFRPAAPLRGVVIACAPAAAAGPEGLRAWPAEMAVRTRLSWTRGIVTSDQAVDAAIDAAMDVLPPAEPPPLGPDGHPGAPDAEISLGPSPRRLYFRTDLKAWLVLIHIPGRSFSEGTLVRVEANGRACRVPYRVGQSAQRLDLERDRIVCPNLGSRHAPARPPRGDEVGQKTR